MRIVHLKDLENVSGGCDASCYPATRTPAHTHGSGTSDPVVTSTIAGGLKGAIAGSTTRTAQGTVLGAAAGAAIGFAEGMSKRDSSAPAANNFV